jgi:hypothetical protein
MASCYLRKALGCCGKTSVGAFFIPACGEMASVEDRVWGYEGVFRQGWHDESMSFSREIDFVIVLCWICMGSKTKDSFLLCWHDSQCERRGR